MKLAILGYGKEGQSVEEFFKSHDYEGEKVDEIKIFDNFTTADVENFGLEKFDAVFRSPSVRPPENIGATTNTTKSAIAKTPSNRPACDSSTKYFFRHCPAPIIGITGTKGKGTTCTLTKVLLEALGEKVHLVGNIGLPCLDELDKIDKNDVAVYELSSFQLWDITKSPKFAAILRLEPDHLDVHKDLAEYLDAKANITKFQNPDDWLVYYAPNAQTRAEAKKSPAQKLEYPIEKTPLLSEILSSLKAPGEHNKENAEAALLLVYAYETQNEAKAQKTTSAQNFESFLRENATPLKSALANFKPLPHHIEFVRELNGVEYYDDSYSTTFPSVDVALKTFDGHPIILIAGGKDKGTNYDELSERIFTDPNLEKAILIGETKEKFAAKAISEDQYKFAETFTEAIENAQFFAEKIAHENARIDEQNFWLTQESAKKADSDDTNSKKRNHAAEQSPPSAAPKAPVVLLSPGASSFDMFTSYSERGDQFKALVNGLR